MNRAFSAGRGAAHMPGALPPAVDEAAPLALPRTKNEFRSVDRAAGRKLAGIQAEGFDVNHAGVEIRVRFQERPDRMRRNIAAPRECDVRVERTEIRLEPNGEKRFLNALVELKQMRMAGADADPDDLRPALGRERSNTGHRKKE